MVAMRNDSFRDRAWKRQSPRSGPKASRLMRSLSWLWLAACICATPAIADEITLKGTITQSTGDGTGPAVNNPSLNGIADGDAFSVTLDFAGSITAAGNYPLAGATLGFFDAGASASETSFDTVSLSVVPDGALFEISLLGCLTTGTGCSMGNQLAILFAIPVADLNAQNVSAQTIPGQLPLDLLEDDGVTDIHGSVSTYSYTGSGAGVVPEPSEFLPVCLGLVALARMYRLAGKSR